MPWLPHTLLTYLQDYFQACNPVINKPKHIRAVINGDVINPKISKDTEFLLPRFMDMLRTYVIGDNMGIHTVPTSSYQLFFPSIKTPKRKPEVTSSLDYGKPTKTSKNNRTQDVTTQAGGNRGFLNNTVKRFYLPW